MYALKKESTVATKFGKIKTSPRYFKRGDVIKMTPMYGPDPTEELGVGIVLESQGPRFKAFWTKTEEILHHNAMLPGGFCLIDSAPLLEAVEIIENKYLNISE
jgi:hypothetical protein